MTGSFDSSGQRLAGRHPSHTLQTRMKRGSAGDTLAGKLNPRMAAGLASLLNLQLRLIHESNVEQRLARVERLLAESDLLKTPDEAEEAQNVIH
jgi:hypothetical protein